MTERLLDVAAAAALLGVPRSWIYVRVEAPDCDLPHFKLGRYIKFRESELVAYMESKPRGPVLS